MRTLSRVSVLCVVIAGTTGATTGCDDVSAGQPKDSSAPPQLVHVLVQDARYFLAFPNRGSSLDILDNNATRSCTIVNAATAKDPQLDTCINEFLVDQLAPDVHCLSSGVCNDPLKIPSTGVPVPLSLTLLGAKPDNRDPGGGMQIRLVFDKVLDNSIETVMMDPSKAPGSTDTYAIMPGLVELDDGAGKPVASAMYYDNGGSHEFSADLELVPLGPAIVIKPKASLDAATTYTVKILNPGAIKDRTGNAAVGLGGGALPTTLTFKTEDLTPANAGDFPSDAAGGNGLDFPDFTASDVEHHAERGHPDLLLRSVRRRLGDRDHQERLRRRQADRLQRSRQRRHDVHQGRSGRLSDPRRRQQRHRRRHHRPAGRLARR